MADVGEQGRQVGRVVRQIGVDLHADVRSVLEGVADAPAVRRAEAELGRTIDHGDVAELADEPVGQLRGPVGAAVVDDDDPDARFDVA